jgi:hypothetical protein
MMVLANFGVWCGVILGIGIKKVFFGRLRGVEYEVSRASSGARRVVFSFLYVSRSGRISLKRAWAK